MNKTEVGCGSKGVLQIKPNAVLGKALDKLLTGDKMFRSERPHFTSPRDEDREAARPHTTERTQKILPSVSSV